MMMRAAGIAAIVVAGVSVAFAVALGQPPDNGPFRPRQPRRSGPSGGYAKADTKPPPAAAALDERLRKRIEEAVKQLGSAKFAERQRATEQLRGMGELAREALDKATASDDAEVAHRARQLIKRLPKLTHVVLDAIGKPLPYARIKLTIASGAEKPSAGRSYWTFSDGQGRIGVTAKPTFQRPVTAHIEHPDYGAARCGVPLPSRSNRLHTPLTRRESPESDRAVHGRVVDPQGRPLQGVLVRCNVVRTRGEGLVNGIHPRGDALSDADGKFSYYLPNTRRSPGIRGALIPPNSRYHLYIEATDRREYFPTTGMYANIESHTITLLAPPRMRRVEFEMPNGKVIDQPKQLEQVFVNYEIMHRGERMMVPLAGADLVRGRPLPPGTYRAVTYLSGKGVPFEPLVIKPDSPDQLRFRMPARRTYRGRVVHGVTQRPMHGAFVMAYASTSRNNLALLSDAEWDDLRRLGRQPRMDEPPIKRLSQLYGVGALVRTDGEGRFELSRPPDKKYYGLIAFDRDHVPFKVRIASLKSDKPEVDAGTFPLFPAAKVVVRPVFKGKRLSVSPKWLPAADGQPEWFDRLQAALNGSDRELEYVHWLRINESQPVYVPAGIKLRLRFETPYQDRWCDATLTQPLELEHGAVHQGGDLSFPPALPAVVEVVNEGGRPVEGVPIRRKYDGTRAWSIAHNTDAKGRTQFHVHPDSRGVFGIIARSNGLAEADNLKVAFSVEDQPPTKPLRITLTADQIRRLLEVKKPRPGAGG